MSIGDRLSSQWERVERFLGVQWGRVEGRLGPRYARLTEEEQRVVALVFGFVSVVVLMLVLGPVVEATGLPLPTLSLPFVISTLALAGMYLLLALGLNVQWGYAGLVNFSVVAFWGIGVYSGALLAVDGDPHGFGFHPIYGLALAIVLSAVLAVAIGLPTLRLRADYLAIATLGFAEIVRIVILNEEWLTRGGLGVTGIPALLEAWPFSLVAPAVESAADVVGTRPSTLLDLAVVLVLALTAFFVLRHIQLSPWGRVLRTIRGDEDVAKALGKNTYWYKMQAFVLGCVIMAIAGWYYAHHARIALPADLEPIETFYVWVAVILGGSGSNRGAVIGGFTVVIILQGTRLYNENVDAILFFLTIDAHALRLLLIGLLVIAVVRLRPAGILPPQREHIWPSALRKEDE